MSKEFQIASDLFEALGFKRVNMVQKPHTFEHFPVDDVCPMCGTSEDTECLLLIVDGTREGTIAEAVPCHLWCAVATNFSRNVNIAYRRSDENKA